MKFSITNGSPINLLARAAAEITRTSTITDDDLRGIVAKKRVELLMPSSLVEDNSDSHSNDTEN